MTKKCIHATSLELFELDGLSVSRCTWACGRALVSIRDGNMTRTYATDEIVALGKHHLDCPTCGAALSMLDGALYCPTDGCAFGENEWTGLEQVSERDYRTDPDRRG